MQQLQLVETRAHVKITSRIVLYRIAELCEKFREKIYPARDTGRRRLILGLSRRMRDGRQP